MKTVYALIAALAFIAAGCQNEVELPLATTPATTVRYTLYANAPLMATPVGRTGSANEEEMATGNFWVMVFDNTGTPADPSGIRLLEITKAEATTSPYPGPYKWVTQLQTRSHAVKLILLANAPSFVYNSSGTGQTVLDAAAFSAGITYAEVVEKLHTSHLSTETSIDYVPYTLAAPPSATAKSIPLCAVQEFAQLDATTNIGTEAVPLRLARLVAKITVENQTPPTEVGNVLKPDFRIVGVNLHNAPRSSNLVPRPIVPAVTSALISYEGALPANYTTAIAPANNADGRSTSHHPLYLYESHETEQDKQPFVILEATYNGTRCYYKLSPITPLTPQVVRNTHYRILIKEATSVGYATYSEAVQAPKSNHLNSRMDVTDLMGHDIIDNGQYYLAVSNSEYILFSSSHRNNVEAVIVSHNLPSTTAQPTIELLDNGATFTPMQDGLILINPTAARFASANTGANQQQSILLDFNNEYASPIKLLIRAGNLSKEIVVRREPSVSYKGGVMTYFAQPKEYVVGQISTDPLPLWVGLSSGTAFSNTAYLAGQGVMPINIIWKENLDQIAEREIEAYFARSNNEGRVRARIAQEAAPL